MERVRLSVRVSPETRERWKKALVDMGVDGSDEALNALLDIYYALVKKYGTRDPRALASLVTVEPVSI